jgi:hypothetical protein
MLQLQLLLQTYFSLVQPTELVDLVLILSPNFNLITPGRCLIFFGQLKVGSASVMINTTCLEVEIYHTTLHLVLLWC